MCGAGGVEGRVHEDIFAAQGGEWFHIDMAAASSDDTDASVQETSVHDCRRWDGRAQDGCRGSWRSHHRLPQALVNEQRSMNGSLRILHAAGTGDIIGTYRCWARGEPDLSEVAMTYSEQFYDVCRELGAQAWVISSHPRREIVRDGQ